MPTIAPTQQVVLGRCAHSQHNFSRFEPLLQCVDGQWQRVSDAVTVFPDVGKVFCVEHALVNLGGSGYWSFTTETNTKFEPGRGGDRLLARGLRPGLQLIDRSHLTTEDARRELVENGIPASSVRAGEVIVRLTGDKCVKLIMEHGGPTGHLRARLNGLDDLDVMRCDPRIADGDTVDGLRFVLPGREPSEIVDSVDWSPDADFLEHALKRLKRLLRTDGRGHELPTMSKNAIEMLSQFLHQVGASSSNGDQLRRLRARLEFFLPKFRATSDDLDTIVALLETYRPVAARIEIDTSAKEREIEAELRCRLEPLVRKEITDGQREAVVELDGVRQNIAMASSERQGLERQVESLRGAATSLRQVLRDELGIVHDALEDLPADADEIAEGVARRLSVALAPTTTIADLLPASIPPWGLGAARTAAPIALEQLRERLESTADQLGLEASDLWVLDSLLRAGELVILFDSQDRLLLDGYAWSVAGARIRKQVLDPSVIGLDDLWRQPGSGAPTPFAKAWTAARIHPDRGIVLVFEYLDASPLGFWLPLLTTELRGPNRPRNLLVVGTLMEGATTRFEDISVLRNVAVPLSTTASSDAWMRLALRRAEREALDPPTTLDLSAVSPPSAADVTSLMGELTGVSGLHPDAAGRAVDTMSAALHVMERGASLQLAMDIGRIAACCGTDEIVIETASLKRGDDRLRILLNKTKKTNSRN